MELEEPDDEEWKKWNICTDTSTSKYYLSQPDESKSSGGGGGGGKVSWVFKRGLNIGKKIIVAGLVASSAPIVVPPLVVASAIGIVVSMPYALFLASHACTENLMSRLLPIPTTVTHYPNTELILGEEEVCFQQDVIGMAGVEDVNNEKDMTLGSDYRQGVAEKEEENAEPQMIDDGVKHGDEEEDEGTMEGNSEPQMNDDVKVDDEVEDEGITEGNAETEMHGDEKEDEGLMEGDIISGVHGIEITIQGLDDENGDDNDAEEFEAAFEVTTVSDVEIGDEAILEGDIEEEELRRETKGLLEKIRDEGKNDSGGEFVGGIHEDTNESDHEIGSVVENLEVAHDKNQSCVTIEGVEGDARDDEDRRVYEEMLESSNTENNDTIYAEVESDEPIIGMLEEKEVDDKNDSKMEMAELGGRSFQFEVIEEDYSVPVSEHSSEVFGEKIDAQLIVKEEQEHVLDDNISDSANQESKLHEYDDKTKDLSDADAVKIAEERSDLDTDGYTIDLHEESSNVVVDGHTAPKCDSGKDVICPAPEVELEEESIWKQINEMRMIIGYEGTREASCVDELKALYIFTGVEPPNFVNENSCDPAEIHEKLHFLMSIVGVKSSTN